MYPTHPADIGVVVGGVVVVMIVNILTSDQRQLLLSSLG